MGKITEYTEKLLAKMKTLPGVVDPDTSLIVGKPEVRAHIDRQKAAELGVSVVDIASSLRLLVGGYDVGNYNEAGEQYDLHVRAEASRRGDVTDLKRISVLSTKLGSVTLDNLVTFTPGRGPAKIERFNRRRQGMVMCNMQKGYSEGEVIAAMQQAVVDLKMDPAYTAAPTGRSKELGRAAKTLAWPS